MRTIPWVAWVRVGLIYCVCVCTSGAVASLVNAYVGLAALALMLATTDLVLGPTLRRRA